MLREKASVRGRVRHVLYAKSPKNRIEYRICKLDITQEKS